MLNWSISLVAILLLSSGCASLRRSSDVTTPGAAAEAPLTEGPGTTHDLSDSGDDLDQIPLEVNRAVLQWIDYFQGRGRPHMERYLARSGRYLPLMKGILKKEGLPEDLVYIALIESGFTSQAHSTANAVGYWQFIKPTGAHYGLEINSYVDERRDFVKSTRAAADFFKGLYNLFGSWYLAIASYNVGENRVKSVVMKHHTRDFWALARDGRLPSETVNYVPKFLAARIIAKSPEKYGFADIEYQTPVAWEDVNVQGPIDLKKFAEGMGADTDEIRALNPSYKRGVALGRSGKLTLRVPPGTTEKALLAVAAAQTQNLRSYATASDDDVTVYRVKRGDTLASIARKFGTTSRKIRTLNRGHLRVVAGHKLKVPGDTLGGLAIRELGAGKKNSRIPQGTRIHVVQRGDTLIQIARRYQVSLPELARKNSLRRMGKVSTGTRLEIPE